MSRRLTWAAFRALAVLAAISCSTDSQPLTEVMVVVDSDLAEIDSVRVRVDGMGEPKVATATDLEKRPLPRSVAIVHNGGPLGPITVTAEGLAGGATLVSRRAQLSFVRGRNLMLRLYLEQSCAGTKCDARDETCVAGSCESVDVLSTELEDWSGKLPDHREAGEGRDAGVDDSGEGMGGGAGSGGQAGTSQGGAGGKAGQGAGSAGMSMKTCTGCGFDSGTTMPHGTIACEDGACVLRCDSRYTNADQIRGNGCEKAVSGFPWTVSNLDPRNPALMAATVAALSVDCSATLDLGSGALPTQVQICSTQLQPVLVPQASGPDLVVFAARSLSVAAGSKLRFTGARPVAFVVYGDAYIQGELDVSAAGAAGGAGSNFACTPGLGGTGISADHAGGGGGGGFGTSGGEGASATSGAKGGLGGATSSDATLVPLRGGCSGGAGGQGEGAMAAGGAGGGAIQISVAGTLRIGGTIAAAGGGGAHGNDESFIVGDGGGGGGSGGAILLEATRLETVSGAWLTTNGGGGGEGRVYNQPGNNGADGAHASTDAAVGGNGPSSGGNGAVGGMPGMAAPACTSSLYACGGGGGGGGLGRVVLRSADCTLGGRAIPAATCAPPRAS